MVTHGYTGTKVYDAWRSMKKRCLNKKDKFFHVYGGRGISISPGWLIFKNFLDDMGEPPSKAHSLDRIDNDGNYEKGNCRWALFSVQVNNTSNCRYYNFRGEKLSMAQIARLSGVDRGALRYQLVMRGKSPSQAIEHIKTRRGA